jgi:probable rRNA maturation factor
MILIDNEQSIKIDTEKLQHDAQKIIDFLGYADFDVSILLCDSPTMHEYNKRYRDKDKPTDILSFSFYPLLRPGESIEASSEDEKNLGDIILCPEYIQNDLAQWEQSFELRLQVLLVHGICHLLGYDHIEDNDYIIMKAKEDELLKIIK